MGSGSGHESQRVQARLGDRLVLRFTAARDTNGTDACTVLFNGQSTAKRDEARALSLHLENAATAFSNDLRVRWPLEEMLGAELVKQSVEQDFEAVREAEMEHEKACARRCAGQTAGTVIGAALYGPRWTKTVRGVPR